MVNMTENYGLRQNVCVNNIVQILAQNFGKTVINVEYFFDSFKEKKIYSNMGYDFSMQLHPGFNSEHILAQLSKLGYKMVDFHSTTLKNIEKMIELRTYVYIKTKLCVHDRFEWTK